ncbi:MULTISPECIES: GGDEF domain-containing protein [unclassified Exiguobacterium]|uniref:GGDEF domain-containing protein n=1 Tax=unclassified Exiguobacterium TaxID=2644629 RepID=UPI001BE61180|nr:MULTISPECIES: GGDEF domain-containing protein [unclassified Exiguobacterium]
MFISLIANSCISFTGIYFISKIMNYDTKYVRTQKILIGVLSGCLGIFLITQGVVFDDVVKIDFRFLVLLLLGFYRLVSPLFITATIISVYRFSYGIDFPSIVSCISLFLIVIGILVTYNIVSLEKRLFQFGLVLNMLTCFIIGFAIYTSGEFSENAASAALLVVMISFPIGLLITVLNIDLYLIHHRVKEYKISAETDHLTGLANRRAWEMQMKKVKEHYATCNVLIIDIDYFKQINDQYGHANGDEILKQFAELLHRETRDHDIKARIGGEEFGILIPMLSQVEVIKVAERIRSSISKHEFELLDQQKIHISVSIGIANGKSEHLREMVHLADDCLYQAKNSGRNRTYINESVIG